MNLKMVAFALSFLRRRLWKNLAVFFVFWIVIFLLSSIFLIAASIKKELFLTLDELPQIFVQRTIAGRLVPSPTNRIESIEQIEGVEAAYGRVWGYYYFQAAGVNFSVVGLDMDMAGFAPWMDEILASDKEGMVVGEGVARILKGHFYKDYFNFITPSGDFLKVPLAGTFPAHTELESSDTILLPMDMARKIFGMPQDRVTDILVRVNNPKEIPTIAAKIRVLYPDSRVLTRADIRAAYQNIFDYKSGLFLALMVGAFFAFFILVFEKMSSVGKEERREIAILKALGWRIGDVLRLKFLESFLIAIFAYGVGVVGAYFFVYYLQAPLLRDIFSGFSVLKPRFELIPVFDMGLLLSIFFATVPLYLAATIVPTWRASVVDPEEALR